MCFLLSSGDYALEVKSRVHSRRGICEEEGILLRRRRQLCRRPRELRNIKIFFNYIRICIPKYYARWRRTAHCRKACLLERQ